MGFQVSPGVNVSEIDLTAVVPSVGTTEGAIAGVFRWGPVDERVLVDSEDTLVQRFGKPTNHNAETFFTAANFLAYGNSLFVARGADVTETFNAIANTGAVASVADEVVKNADSYPNVTFDANTAWVARYPGELGNSLKISVVDSANAYSQDYNIATDGSAEGDVSDAIGDTFLTFTPGSKVVAVQLQGTVQTFDSSSADDDIIAILSVGDILEAPNGQLMKITTIGAPVNTGANPFLSNWDITCEQTFNGAAVNVSTQDLKRRWEFFNNVDRAPGTSQYLVDRSLTAVDELHVVVADEDGLFSGVPGSVLEVFESLSRATDAKTETGATNYYKDVLNNLSNYVWWTADRSGAASALASAVVTSTNLTPSRFSFNSGADGTGEDTVSVSAVTNAYDLFANPEDVDVSLVLAGSAQSGGPNVVANYLISNIAEVRKDCLVLISPARADVVQNANPAQAVVAFRNNITNNSSYAVLDSGYKYMNDKYNDVFRWVPLNGDIAGTIVRTDQNRDPWFSPAGFNRGQIKNVTKLAYSPNQSQRDLLYKNDVNPVVLKPGQGTILFGDKTLLGQPSAFDRINVRRLFIVLEKAIARAAASLLFEFNDEFTRARFRNIVEPFLRDVQGRRGITDFEVRADENNNTAAVIDRGEFVGDIFIKPARSINFVQLNFVAVGTGVTFSEIVGGV